jgi:hypothetical protein
LRHGPLVAPPPLREEPCDFVGGRGAHC